VTTKIPIIGRGFPITAEYLNSLARAINAGQIVLPADATGGAAVSSPSGSGSTPPSDVRIWTVTAVTTEEEVISNEDETCSVTVTRVTGFTMEDGAGAVWTIAGFGVF